MIKRGHFVILSVTTEVGTYVLQDLKPQVSTQRNTSSLWNRQDIPRKGPETGQEFFEDPHGEQVKCLESPYMNVSMYHSYFPRKWLQIQI